MDSMEEKISAILSNPQMMQQLQSMAQAFSSQASSTDSPKQQPQKPEDGKPPEFDLGMLQQLSGITKMGSIDSQQSALLKALSPYLSNNRISKLEKAMRAAKMAKIASLALGQKG